MRTEQDQLKDLTEAILRGVRNIRRRRLIKYAYPIVLEGLEGAVLFDLLELTAAGDKDKPDSHFDGAVYFEKSPIFYSNSFPLPDNEMNSLTRL